MLHGVRRGQSCSCAVLRQRLQLPTLPALLLQRHLRWFGHAARRAPGEFIRELINPDVPRTWRRRTGGQLKTWAATLKADLSWLIGPITECALLAMDLAQDRLAWSAADRDSLHAIEAYLGLLSSRVREQISKLLGGGFIIA